MTLPHVSTFQRFLARIDDQLQASVAFGLFMEAEQKWAEHNGDPTDAKYRNYQKQLTEHDIDRFANDANVVLSRFASAAVVTKRAEILQENLERYEAAAGKGHSAFRGWGVAEALGGAFAWTFLLIGFSFLLKYYGIDLIEVYHKVFGH
ncbi:MULTISPECIES: hypothetical protein [unclassified Bradyrhizobium]|uniref:hypothetical protein n=1 Tax=unclassified Bradyrhizobium TaxID=2631580 RepID=UPI0028E4AA20|nr:MULTISPECIES: hypothetical protein [unclassified Bradyrhizobium]